MNKYIDQVRKGVPVSVVKNRAHSKFWHDEMSKCGSDRMGKQLATQNTATLMKSFNDALTKEGFV